MYKTNEIIEFVVDRDKHSSADYDDIIAIVLDEESFQILERRNRDGKIVHRDDKGANSQFIFGCYNIDYEIKSDIYSEIISHGIANF